jgi:hypothetical protein
MAKIKLKVKAKTLTAKQKADAAKKAKAMAKKKLSKVIAKDRAIKKSVAAKKAKGEGRAVNKDIQKKQQESKMATPVGKGRISESVKEVRKDKQTPEIGTRGAAPRALLRRRPKSADEKRRDAILSDKGEGASSAQKAAMKETRKIEAPRRALNTLRSRVEKLRRKASKTDAEKAQLKKLVARLNKMESRREAMIQAGRSGSAKVSLAGPSGKIAVDTRKIKRRMAKGGKR